MKQDDLHFPDFLFVGTAKAGTTSIFNYLKQHPKISIPKKETFYYIRNQYIGSDLDYPQQRKKDDVILKRQDLETLYSNIPKEQLVGEIGTGYLFNYKEAIPEIQSMIGTHAKILIVLRNPINRTFSGYMHFKKYSIELDELLQEIKKEPQRKKEGFDFMWQFSGLSYYAEAVSAYLKAFSQVKILFYEDLQQDPKSFMNEILQFIGLDPFEFDFSKMYNPSGNAKNSALQKVITGDYSFKNALRPLYYFIFGKNRVQSFRNKIRDKNLEKAELNQMESQYLKDLFREDIKALQDIIGNSITLKDKWQIH